MKRLLRLLCLVLALGSAHCVFAGGGIQFEYGDGDDGIERFGGALQWEWSWKWFTEGDWYLGGYWELSGGYWDGDEGRTGNDSLGDFGLTPVFRLQPHADRMGVRPFVEAGVGAHVHTDTEIEDKDFDIAFAFGSHVGAGLRFGSRGQFELLYRYQHLSNASIGDSNPGINFHLFRIGYWF